MTTMNKKGILSMDTGTVRQLDCYADNRPLISDYFAAGNWTRFIKWVDQFR